jgi:hypothetical protein
MGNHEYCTECGLSSFHYGKPCPAEAYEKHQADKRKQEAREQAADKAAAKLMGTLKDMGYEAEINYYGHVQIEKWSLIDGRH